jgi:hypothetical protein
VRETSSALLEVNLQRPWDIPMNVSGRQMSKEVKVEALKDKDLFQTPGLKFVGSHFKMKFSRLGPPFSLPGPQYLTLPLLDA